MATNSTSDIFHKFSCTPCSAEDINIEASVYCVNCKEYFCKSCFKFHNRMPETKRHCVVDKSDFKDGLKMSAITTPPDILTEKCSKHHNNVVNLYCGDHGEIGCSVCIEVEHRYSAVLMYLKNAEVNMKACKGNRNGLFSITFEAGNDVKDVLSYKTVLGRLYTGHITTTPRDQTDSINVKIKSDRKACDISDVCSSLDLLCTGHIPPKIGDQTDSINVKIQSDKKASDISDLSSSLGHLYTGHIIPTIGDQTDSINVKIKSDKKACDIIDLCSLPNGTIIITDLDNKKLKSLQFDSDTYRVSGSLSLSGYPWGVCSLDGYEVAVTVPCDCLVHVVSVMRTMSIRNSIIVNYQCHSIAYSDRHLYVGHLNDAKLTVYDLQGNYLQTISTDHTGASLFREPRQLCVLPKHRHIAVADGYQGVTVIDMAGNLVTRYTYPGMKHINGVCGDGSGNMFIAVDVFREVVVIGIINPVIPFHTKVEKRSQSVLFDTCTQSLWVTYEYRDHIQKLSIVY